MKRGTSGSQWTKQRSVLTKWSGSLVLRLLFSQVSHILGRRNITLGSLTWELYTGNGLPLDITIELAREKGKEVDLASFNELKQKARVCLCHFEAVQLFDYRNPNKLFTGTFKEDE